MTLTLWLGEMHTYPLLAILNFRADRFHNRMHAMHLPKHARQQWCAVTLKYITGADEHSLHELMHVIALNNFNQNDLTE